MADLIITPSTGKIEFIHQGGQAPRIESIILHQEDGLVFSGKISASSVTAPLNVINVTAGSSNVNYPFIFASSGETGAKSLLMDSAGGTYNPSTNTATIDVSGNSATTTLASNSTQLGGVDAASYVTLTGTQTLTNKTITGTFTGNLTGTSSWASNATNALQLGGTAAASYVTLTGTQTLTGKTITGTFTGNLTGTSSWSSNAVTSLACTGNAATVTNGAYLNTAQTFTAIATFAVPSRTISYTTPSIQLYTGDNTPPGIAFHRGGVSATYLYESGGELYTNPWTAVGQTGKLLAAGNYTDYTVTKTGTGASGNWTITSSWATNALTATNSTQLNGQAASYYTDINARLGYTPVNKAGDTVTGNLIINGNFSVNGSFTAFSASNVYISSSQLYIEDNILTLNAFSPYLRYAGVEMYDSGSGTLSSLLWDGEADYFFLTGSSVNGKIITGPDGQTNLTANFVPKATAGYKLGNSLIYDDGTNVGIGTTIPGRKLHLYAPQSVISLSNTGTGAWSGLQWSVGNGAYTAYSGLLDDTGRYFIDVGSNGEDFTILQNGNVGIGTTSPAQLLELKKTTGSAIAILNYNDSVKFNINASSGGAGYVGMITNHPLIFVINDAEKVRIDTSGNVGIGTSSPAAKLDVVGSAAISSTLTVTGTTALNGAVNLSTAGTPTVTLGSASSYGVLTATGTNAASIYLNGASRTGFEAKLQFGAAEYQWFNGSLSSQIMMLNTTGLGIGTTSPTGELHIYASQPAFRIQSSVSGSMQFGQWDGTYNRIQSSARDFLLISTDATNLIFSTNTTERMRITSGGNVGIGTTSPAYKLQVAATTVVATLNSTLASSSSISTLLYRNVDGNSNPYSISSIAGESAGNGGYGTLILSTAFNNSLVERVRITTGGNVGIGTTSPSSKLHVYDNGGSFKTDLDATYHMGILNEYVSTYVSRTKFGRWNGTSNLELYYDIAGTEEARITRNYSTAVLKFNRSTTTDMIIDGNGNVGIGTTSPTARLQLGTLASVQTSIPETISLGGTFSNSAGSNIKLKVYEEASAIGGMSVSSGQMEVTTWSTGKIAFYRGTTQSAIIDINGNLGIGTSSPSQLLHVYKGNNGGLGGAIMIDNNGAVAANETALMFGDGGASYIRAAISSTTENSPYYGDLKFKTGVSVYSSLTTRMIIKGDGNVGIGTTLPFAKLHVQGNISGSSFTSSISNAVGFLGTSSWATNATNALQLGGTAAADYVTLTGTQTLTGKTITGTFTGNLTGNVTGTATTASYANALNPANNYTVNSLTEGGYLAYPLREYVVNFSAQSTTSFYPIVIDSPPGTDGTWHHSFSIDEVNQGGAAAYNIHSMYGEVRGQGWTDQPYFHRVFHNFYDSAERSLLGVWRPTTSWYGVVVYVRGGKNYYVRTTSRSVNGYSSATNVGGTVTYAIKNAAGADVSGTSANIAEMLNLINNPSGFYHSDNAYIGTNQAIHLGTTSAPNLSIGGTAATATSANAVSFTEVELNAPVTVSGTWTTGNGSEWGEPKFGSTFNQFRHADGDGPYVEYNVPANHHACFISQLQWDTGGYADCHGVQSDGDLVFLRRINTRQLVENSNHGNTIQHDGSTVTFVGSGLGSFTKIRITNRSGRIHMTGIAFTRQSRDGYEGTGMVHPAQISHQGAGSGLNADLLDGYNSATANTANTIVLRDASGNFSAGTITATLSGTATTATTANALNTSNSYTGVNFTATGFLQTNLGNIKSDTSFALLTTTNGAQSVSVKGILLGTSYDTAPGANEIRTTNNTSLYLNARGTGDIQFQTADSLKMMLLSNGSVGIGTSGPGKKLDVEGVVRTRGATGTGGFEIGAATTGAAKWRIEWDSASDSLDFNWVG